jgi:hypothetical protein
VSYAVIYSFNDPVTCGSLPFQIAIYVLGRCSSNGYLHVVDSSVTDTDSIGIITKYYGNSACTGDPTLDPKVYKKFGTAGTCDFATATSSYGTANGNTVQRAEITNSIPAFRSQHYYEV